MNIHTQLELPTLGWEIHELLGAWCDAIECALDFSTLKISCNSVKSPGSIQAVQSALLQVLLSYQQIVGLHSSRWHISRLSHEENGRFER